MRQSWIAPGVIVVLIIFGAAQNIYGALADDQNESRNERNRDQYPSWLSKSYVEFNTGYINSSFGEQHIRSGYRAASITVPSLGARLTLGYNFNKHISAQLIYARPIRWAVYTDVNEDASRHTAWTNIGALAIRATAPLNDRLSAFGEGGLTIVTRHGFRVDGTDVVDDANYTTLFLGGGIRYRLNEKLSVLTSTAYVPPNENFRQPRTLMVTGGIAFNLCPIPADRTEENRRLGAMFPKSIIHVGYTTKSFGTSINRLVAERAHIFWSGNVDVANGVTLRYHRNIFHTKSLFSLD